MTGWLTRGRETADGIEVAESDQPALWSLVRRTASSAGAGVPRQLFLGGDMTVVGCGNGQLRIGLALINALPAEQLATVIAHELAIAEGFDAGQDRAAYAQWTEAVQERVFTGDDEPEPWVIERITAGDHRGRTAEERADRAAASIAGTPQRAAAALVAQSLAAAEFQCFIVGEIRARSRLAGGLTQLHERWSALVGAGFDDPAWDEDDAAALAAVHAPLGDEIAHLADRSPQLDRPVGTLTLNPLGTRDLRRLGRMAIRSLPG